VGAAQDVQAGLHRKKLLKSQYKKR
jgi:hypothetical protein